MTMSIISFSSHKLISFAHHLMVLMIISWLAWGVATMTWLVVADVQAESTVNNVVQQSVSKAISLNMRTVSNAYLFGRLTPVNKPVIESSLAGINAPETSLKLKLVGLRRGSGNIPSSAIIEGPDKKQAIYYIGDELPSGGARVAEIFVQHMIISRQGKYETLTLFEILNKELEQADEMRVEDGNLTDLTSSQFLTTKINKYKQLALKDPMSLNGVVNVLPIYDGEQFNGYELSRGADGIFFRKAGLKSGDILVSINGVVLDSPNKALSVMGSLAISNDLDITINRNGELMSFRYNFK